MIEPVESVTVDGTALPRGELEEGSAYACQAAVLERCSITWALWRLNELGLLPRLERISSVSGGSIVAGLLGMNWHRLGWDDAGTAVNFDAARWRATKSASDRLT